MRVLIIALLAAISYAQTERRRLETYTVGSQNLFPNQQAPWTSSIEHNSGMTVINGKRTDIYQVKCATSADCEHNDAARGPSGFYCDAGACTLCPIGGLSDCDNGDNTLITEPEVCKADCAAYINNGITCVGSNVDVQCDAGTDTTAHGVDTTGGNNGWFCNMKAIGNAPEGKCTRCSFVNTDIRGQTDQCYSMPWHQENTFVTCAATCQIYERNQQVPVSVDGTLMVSGISELENKYGTPAGEDPFCRKYGSEYCTDGSFSSGPFASIFRDFDHELEGCTSRVCDPDTGMCMLDFTTEKTPCVTEKVNKANDPVLVAGSCSEGQCLVMESSVCPNGYATKVYDFPDCTRTSYQSGSNDNSQDLTSNFIGSHCDVSVIVNADPQCRGFGPQANNVLCTTESEYGGTNPATALSVANGFFYPAYFNPTDQNNPEQFEPNNVNWSQAGTCIVGNANTKYDCVIKTPGLYIYRSMEINYYEQDSHVLPNTRNAMATVLFIQSSTRNLVQTIKCPDASKCFGTMSCEWYTTSNAQFPCGAEYDTCYTTTGTPTMSPIASSHGDPIIWTFNDECYDLNMDGKYVASAHPKYDHKVNIVVYNDYMREIEVVNKKGDVLLSINVDGEYVADNYPYAFEVYEKECPAKMKQSECLDSYMSFRFDAQEFQYFVHILRHNYADPSLKEGELGYHLDIYPTPYDRFYQEGHKEMYSGLYFSNPLPEELEYCAGGADRRPRD